MGSEEQIPGDVISMGESDSEEENSHVEKRSIADVDGPDGEENQPSKAAKRPKLSRQSPSSDASKVSEEGEIEESLSKSLSSQSSISSLRPRAKSFVPWDPPLFTTDTVNLKLPALSRRKEGSWVDRVTDWTTVLCTINFDSLAEIKPATVVSAFGQYVDVHSGLKAPKRKSAKQTVCAMEDSGKLATIIGSTQAPAPAPAAASPEPADEVENGQVPDSPEYVPSDSVLPEHSQAANSHASGAAAETNGVSVPEGQPTAEQLRYFPSAENAADMCVLCGHKGHVAGSCSHTKCKFCGETGHWAFSCKAIQARCGKCRQLGHETSSCVEKLALTKDEGLACAYCGLQHHLEGDCTEPWRSFHAEGDVVFPVIAIQASCAVCGSRNHFASDCSQKGNRPFNPSWTLRNRDLFVDANCGNESIEEAASPHLRAEPNTSQRQTRAPRGPAARAMNVRYSESDDSDDIELLGQRAAPKHQQQRAPRAGSIRVATNLQMPTLGGHVVQPPLPPGPPPPLPPQSHPPPPGTSGYSRNQHGPPPSLPPKPPTARNNHRGPPPPGEPRHGGGSRGRGGPPRGRGGRGGGGGRGRGRGRGQR
ncbi:Zinc finger, CCHC retroviral-type [Cordyceps fumosorosea ARSEF 2679]|uniref:Zinc finger, CCHC retroviral-type n=1 Tax=Cordyceps fumosorosea (strain ARSEF 2679) TaxID=1081104 RepID=A0A167QIA1_CORFA|nr:Zinc finger, CCHC retroviral-type [Cordyceps fumosorosea ARSEF 2679]OAA57666.1 Zinc finger, CCHC retroviral-type [Cordyceps fumosorosea ARSEF 2679]